MHIAILTPFHYPDGGAGAARHMAFASGLGELGHQVTFILLHQARPPDEHRPAVAWIPAPRPRLRSRYLWRFGAARAAILALHQLHGERPVDGVLLTGRDPLLLELITRGVRRCGLVVAAELTELPEALEVPRLRRLVTSLYVRRRLLHAVDGVWVVTHALARHVERFSATPVCVVGPMTDLSGAAATGPPPLADTLRIGYAGSLFERKDGVGLLLEAAAQARATLGRGLDVEITILGGDPGGPQASLLRQRAEALGLRESIRMHGTVPHAEVTPRLRGCHVLVLPRPRSRQADYGFPTKLGEYLATGLPVIASGVGDIPSYVQDGKDCLLVEPGSVRSLARALVEVASDFDGAAAMGRRGRLCAERSFAAPAQAERIASFFSSLRART